MRLKVLIALLMALSAPLKALDPLPEVYYGPGFLSWTLPQDSKLWAMEKLMERLRDPDIEARNKVMKAIGFEKVRVGRNLMWPEIEQPIKAEAKWLGIERRKLVALTIPMHGKHDWVLVLFRQDANDETYWRPVQFMKFDTDPIEGLPIEFPDINGEEIYFLQVKHLIKDDIYGDRIVTSIFKFDEKQLRLTFQETERLYRLGKFAGDPTKFKQTLKFPGNQHIERTLEVKTYPFMKDPEFYKYDDSNVTPRKVEKLKERFAWTPQFFSFYDPYTEMEKLLTHKSRWIRREAARRLGEVLKTTNRQLEKALLKDKDAYVRVQVALALQNIGDPEALPALKRAMENWDEPEEFTDVYERAWDHLAEIKAKRSGGDAEARPKIKKKAASGENQGEALPPISPEGPKVSDKK